jgi:hypothetical protein
VLYGFDSFSFLEVLLSAISNKQIAPEQLGSHSSSLQGFIEQFHIGQWLQDKII